MVFFDESTLKHVVLQSPYLTSPMFDPFATRRIELSHRMGRQRRPSPTLGLTQRGKSPS